MIAQPSDRWGESPCAVVVCSDPSLTEAEIYHRCRSELAGYKQPKAVYFIAYEDFPRSASGKVQLILDVARWVRDELAKLGVQTVRDPRGFASST